MIVSLAAACASGAGALPVRGDPSVPRRQRPRRTSVDHSVPGRARHPAHTSALSQRFFEATRRDYYDRLFGVSTRGEWSVWLEILSQRRGASGRDALSRAERINGLLVKSGAKPSPARRLGRPWRWWTCSRRILTSRSSAPPSNSAWLSQPHSAQLSGSSLHRS